MNKHIVLSVIFYHMQMTISWSVPHTQWPTPLCYDN